MLLLEPRMLTNDLLEVQFIMLDSSSDFGWCQSNCNELSDSDLNGL